MILADRVAVITAAGSGIGRASAVAMAREGAYVIVTDRDHDSARGTVEEITAAGGTAKAAVLDVADEDAIVCLLNAVDAEHGHIDILHNHAGIQVAGNLEEVSTAEFDKSWQVNVHAQFAACQTVMPIMRRQRRGVILNTASNAGVFLDKGMLAYITTKSAVITMTKQIALDYACHGIRVNALCPGWVDSPFNGPYTHQLGGRAALERIVSNAVPMGRFGKIDEIGEAVLFLVSDRSSYITGHALVVDGGECLAGGVNSSP